MVSFPSLLDGLKQTSLNYKEKTNEKGDIFTIEISNYGKESKGDKIET